MSESDLNLQPLSTLLGDIVREAEEHIEQNRRAEQIKEADLTAQGFAPEVIEKIEREASQIKCAVARAESSLAANRRTANEWKDRGLHALAQLQKTNGFKIIDLNPGNEYPTLYTRVPIFIPAPLEVQKTLTDKDNAVPFDTGFCKGRRFGVLNIYDEDTILALARLRQRKLIGRGGKLPISMHSIGSNPDRVEVDSLYTTLSAIEEECGQTASGKNLKRRLDSIRRIAACSIELERSYGTSSDPIVECTNIRLFSFSSRQWKENGVIYVQFTPEFVALLGNQKTYINWSVRQKLRPTGKAIHRFLSSQKRKSGNYKISTKRLADNLMYQGASSTFNRELKRCLAVLREEGWLDNWEIEGTGRKSPHVMIITWGGGDDAPGT